MPLKETSGWMRLLMLMSAIWLAVVTIIIYHDFKSFRMAPFLGFGLIPLLLLWGTRWVIQGFKKEKRVELKKCPYCAEEINSKAVKCKYCNESLVQAVDKMG